MFKLVDEHLEEAVVVALMAMMSALIGLQIFMRYVMGASLSWSEELSRYFFIWATYIGIAYAVRKDAHIRVTMATDLLSPKGQAVIRILTHIIFGAFALFVMYQGWFMVEKTFRFGQKSASLGMPMGIIYLAPFTGLLLVVLRLIQAIVTDLRAAGQGDAR
ncbi:MAG: TRAP transporter small permease [Alphaproteobacteria bacterium]|jgi:TRAP-type C4-dicarboxylate transport system permease small subunit|nr:TRAP transporter small permease [Rhizobiaceae bacterium]MBC7148893.1 TRAP transporter small permease [Rhizobium sp.]MBU3961955.1 TRAP transporter small permease [Alphaproteobacteria bacterium]MBU4050419.1 TRAP transporter small permease [Alphaproteobacteria bacterium]MBU4091216.1 TRAP transporter small permease [Alphaproteobacteria bacterium]